MKQLVKLMALALGAGIVAAAFLLNGTPRSQAQTPPSAVTFMLETSRGDVLVGCANGSVHRVTLAPSYIGHTPPGSFEQTRSNTLYICG